MKLEHEPEVISNISTESFGTLEEIKTELREIEKQGEHRKGVLSKEKLEYLKQCQSNILDAPTTVESGVANRQPKTKQERSIVETPLSVDIPRRAKVKKDRNFF